VRPFFHKIALYRGFFVTVIFSLALTFVLLFPTLCQAARYSPNWQYRKAITIDGSQIDGEPRTDFPVLISTTDTNLSESSTDNTDLLTITAQSVTSTAVAPIQRTHELIFVDLRVPDRDSLLADLTAQASHWRRFEIITLDAARDGIEQVSEFLKDRRQLDAIHFLTHGTDGAVQFGGGWLNAQTLAANTEAVAGWGQALKADADLLFYGCDLAASARGRELMERVAELTQADVAASTDRTGHASQGGDWDLEYTAGSIESRVVFGAKLRQNWNHVLAVAIDNTSFDTTTGLSINIPHATAGSNRLMLVGVSIAQASTETVASITYNTIPLTRVDWIDSAGGQMRVEIWQLTQANGLTTGIHDVVVTFDNAAIDGAAIGIITFTGVNQTTPLGLFASNTGAAAGSASVAVDSAADELVFGVVGVDDGTDYDLTTGAGASQTVQWDLAINEGNGAGSTQPGAAPTVTTSWTWPGSDDWAIAGISIKPAARVLLIVSDAGSPAQTDQDLA
jgi:hypothetical protein